MSTDLSTRQPEDAALVEAISTGDSEALDQLYQRFSNMLMGLALRILGDVAESEDVLQEVFLQVWRQAERYDSKRSSVSTWLALITRSRAIDRLRTRKVVERTAQDSFHENPRADTSPEGDGNVLHKERSLRLLEELHKLPEEQREILKHSFFTGLTQSEISKRTGIPLGTVKTRTLLAMKKLRKALGGEIRDLI